MRLKVISLIMLALIVGSTACKKDKEGEYNSTVEFTEANKQETQHYSFSSDETYICVSEAGIHFTFFGETFSRSDHEEITGNIDIELREFHNAADIIFEEFPTVSSGNLLESAGFFYIKTTNNGNTVVGKIGISIPADTINTEMEVFYGTPNTDPMSWIQDPDSTSTLTFTGIGTDSTNCYYIEYFNHYNWINCDYFVPGPKCDFTLEINRNPSIANTRVLFVLDSINSVASFSHMGDSEYHLDYIPVGTSGILFSYLIHEGEAFYYEENMTLPAVVEKEIVLELITEEELEDIINNL